MGAPPSSCRPRRSAVATKPGSPRRDTSTRTCHCPAPIPHRKGWKNLVPNLESAVPAIFTDYLTPSSGFALCGLIIWRLFPDGLPGMLRAWSDYRTAAMARKLAATANDPGAGLALLRTLHGMASAGTESDTPDQPPDAGAPP